MPTEEGYPTEEEIKRAGEEWTGIENARLQESARVTAVIRGWMDEEEANFRNDNIDRVTLASQVDALRTVVGSPVITDNNLRNDIHTYLVSGVEGKRPYKAMAENEDLFKRVSTNVRDNLKSVAKGTDNYDALDWVSRVVDYMANAPKAYKPYRWATPTGYWGGQGQPIPGEPLEQNWWIQTEHKVPIVDTEGQWAKNQTENVEAFKKTADDLSLYLQGAVGGAMKAPKLSSDVEAAREASGLQGNKSRYIRQYVQAPTEGVSSPTQRSRSVYGQSTKVPLVTTDIKTAYTQSTRTNKPSPRSASSLYTRVKTSR